MLARMHKIKGRLAIQRVFVKGRKWRSPGAKFFSIRFLPRRIYASTSAEKAGPLFAVIVPNVLKLNPVKRNRVRRRVYDAIQKHMSFTKGKNYYIVVVVHRPVMDTEFSELEREIAALLHTLPLL